MHFEGEVAGYARYRFAGRGHRRPLCSDSMRIALEAAVHDWWEGGRQGRGGMVTWGLRQSGKVPLGVGG